MGLSSELWNLVHVSFIKNLDEQYGQDVKSGLLGLGGFKLGEVLKFRPVGIG